MKILQEADVREGTKVLVRYDLDVPVSDGKILEKYRLDAGLETLHYILAKKGFPIIAGHMGKPDGKVVPELSTKQLLPYFNENLGEGAFDLLENLRFDPREETNDPTFAQELASKANIYVNESFATCHREHTSIVGVAQKLPAYAGLHLQTEVTALKKLLDKVEHPFITIIGGAKLESKMPVVSKFLKLADFVLLGGMLGLAWQNKSAPASRPNNLVLPVDYAQDNKDIGPKTIDIFTQGIDTAKTVLWAGPMGMYEQPEFLEGTRRLAKRIAEKTVEDGIYSVVGGGDTLAAIQLCVNLEKFSFVSTGGGAMLQFLADGNLPGLKVLGYEG
jgi:3-phosphoglycerate kinase